MAIRKGICQRLREKKDLVVKGFSSLTGLKDMIWKDPTGAFYFFPCVKNYLGKMSPAGKKIENDEDFAMYLIESVQVVVLPGSKFERKDHIRMAFACISDSQLVEGLEKMAVALEKLQ
jgi:aspartate aminotransferase